MAVQMLHETNNTSVRAGNRLAAAVVETLESRRLLASGDLGYAITFGQHDEMATGNAVATDASGNTYVAGKFHGQIDADPTKRVQLLRGGGNDAAFIIKYGPTGKLVWAKRLYGVGDAQAMQLKAGPSGDIYVAGVFSDTVGFGGKNRELLKSNGKNDVFVMRMRSDGRLLWKGTMGGELDDGVNAMAIGPTGDVYLSGSIRMEGDIDPTAKGVFRVKARGVDDTFVVRLGGSDGHLVWQKVYGENDTREEASGLAVDSSGGVFVCGNFIRTVQFDRDSAQFDRESVRKADVYLGHLSGSKGKNAKWDSLKTFGGTGEDLSAGLAMTPTGDLCMTGTFGDEVAFGPGARLTLNPIGEADAFIGKFTSEGDAVWVQQIGGGDARVGGSALAVDSSGTVYATGSFDDTVVVNPGAGQVELPVDKSGDGRSPTSRIGSTDVYVVKYATNGVFAYAKQIGGHDAGIVSGAIDVDAAGNAYVTGNYNGTVDFDPGPGKLVRKTSDERGESAAYLLKLLA